MKKTFLRSVIVALLILAMVVSIVGCAATSATASSAPATSGVIKFASACQMTGDSANMGIQHVASIEIACDEINTAGGINGKKLELEQFDDQANPNQAAIVAQKIVSDKDITFVIGHINSGCTLAAEPVYIAAGMPVISAMNSSTSLTKHGFKNFLRTNNSDDKAVMKLVDLAVIEFGYKRPVIFHTDAAVDTENFKIAKDYLKSKYNVDVLGDASITPETDRDYSAHITKFKALNPDCIFVFTDYTPAGLLFKQMGSFEYKLPAFASAGISNPQFIEIAGAEFAEDVFTSAAFVASNPDPAMQEYVKKYVAKNGAEPGEWGSLPYAAMMVIANSLKAGATKENLIEKMKDAPKFTGMISQIKFNENGDNVTAKSIILRVKEGKWQMYVPTKE